MPGLLFQFNKQDNVILDPDAIKLAPGLKNLKQQEILFIILAYDYRGPFHQLDAAERIRRAKRQAYGNTEVNLETKKLVTAIEEYKGLQFSIDKENQATFQEKIAELRYDLMSAKEAAKIKQISETIKYLSSEVDNIQQKIDIDTEARLTSGGDKITFIEQWQINQKNFRKHKQQKEIHDQKVQEKKDKIEKINLSE